MDVFRFRTGLEGGIPDPDEGSGGNAAAARLHRHALLILIPQPVSCFSCLDGISLVRSHPSLMAADALMAGSLSHGLGTAG